MNKDTFAFGTDFHGNLNNVDTFLNEAAARQTEYVLFGGDIAPKKIAFAGSDGNSFHIKNSYDQNDIVQLGDSNSAYRSGYILLPEELGSEEAEQMVTLLDKISRSVHFGRDKTSFNEHPNWEETDFQLLEKYLKQEFINYLKSNIEIKKIYENLAANLKKHHKIKMTPAIAWTHYVNMQKARYLGSKGINIRDARAGQLFGYKQKMNDSQLMKVISFHMTDTSDFDSIFRAFSKHFPRISKWNEIQRDTASHSVEGQQKSVADLIRKISEFQQATRAKIICILGNDDHPEVEDQFLEAENSGILHYAGNRVVQVDPDLQVLGYNHVLPLRFSFDTWYKTETEIARDLEALRMQLRNDVTRTVFNVHMPPAGLGLSMAKIDNPYVEDYGSEAVASIIKDTAPSHVFSGHMHKSWLITGKTHAKIGTTHVYNPGDSEQSPRLIFGDFNNPENTELVTE